MTLLPLVFDTSVVVHKHYLGRIPHGHSQAGQSESYACAFEQCLTLATSTLMQCRTTSSSKLLGGFSTQSARQQYERKLLLSNTSRSKFSGHAERCLLGPIQLGI
jgi:hypothetical protein